MPELRDLELLVSLSRHKNFSHAAADCNISQPAFSTRIRKLEEEFKLPLVRRGNSFLGFTREGEVALKWARKLLADAEGMRQEINALRNNLDGKLTLGVIPTAMPFAARVSSQLRRKHPNLSIEIHSQSTRQITRRLNDFSLDAGIMYFDDADPDITVKLYEERYVLIAPQTLASGYKTQVTWAEAAQFPLCLLTPDMRNRQLLADAEGMRQEINALRNNLDGKLTLGVIPTAMPFAARVSSQLRRKHPNLSIEIHSQSTRQITRRLNDFSLDAGIMYFDDADPDITVKLYEERYVLIAPQTLASGYKTQVTWAEAAQFPLCLLTPDMRNRQLIDAVFEQVSAVPTVVMEASGFSAVLAQVVSGNAATIAPVSVAETFLALSSTVQFDLVKPVMTHTIGLSIKDQSPVLPMVQALRQAIDASL